MKIHFFHTNDVHSHFEEYLQIATQLRRAREAVQASGETVFTFDIGDHADRKRMETEGTFGRTNASLLGLMNYDACTIGNNEGLTLPKETWADTVNESKTPTLVANLFDDQTGEPFAFFEPYIILERDGIRVAVLGLTVPFFDFYKMFGMQAEHPRDTFARVLPLIKQQDVDLVVLLSHLGLGSLPADCRRDRGHRSHLGRTHAQRAARARAHRQDIDLSGGLLRGLLRASDH